MGAFGLAKICEQLQDAKPEEIPALTTQLTRALPAVVDQLNGFLIQKKSS